MTCRICGETYPASFNDEFRHGVCLPCRENRRYEDREKEKGRQLAAFNRICGSDYSENELFYYAPELNPVLKSILRRLSLVREIFQWRWQSYQDDRDADLQQKYTNRLIENHGQLELF